MLGDEARGTLDEGLEVGMFGRLDQTQVPGREREGLGARQAAEYRGREALVAGAL